MIQPCGLPLGHGEQVAKANYLRLCSTVLEELRRQRPFESDASLFKAWNVVEHRLRESLKEVVGPIADAPFAGGIGSIGRPF